MAEWPPLLSFPVPGSPGTAECRAVLPAADFLTHSWGQCGCSGISERDTGIGEQAASTSCLLHLHLRWWGEQRPPSPDSFFLLHPPWLGNDLVHCHDQAQLPTSTELECTNPTPEHMLWGMIWTLDRTSGLSGNCKQMDREFVPVQCGGKD